MILSQVITLSLLQVASATPYYDFLYRLEEFKTRALEGEGCDWWRDVLKLQLDVEQPGHFCCDDGLCVASEKVCDGVADCESFRKTLSLPGILSSK